jgi:hypothetical protein
MIDNRCVLHQLDADGWTISYSIRSFATTLALASNETGSVIRLMADLVQFGWPQKPSRAAYVDLVAVLFGAFRRLQPQRDLDTLINTVLSSVQARLRSNGYRVFLKKQLLNNVPSISAKALVNGITQAADEIFEPIAEAVIAGLAKARLPPPESL